MRIRCVVFLARDCCRKYSSDNRFRSPRNLTQESHEILVRPSGDFHRPVCSRHLQLLKGFGMLFG